MGFFTGEKATQREGFEAGFPTDVHADICVDVWPQKLRSGSKSRQKQDVGPDIHDPKARTSIPQGVQRHFRQKIVGPVFLSLLLEDGIVPFLIWEVIVIVERVIAFDPLKSK